MMNIINGGSHSEPRCFPGIYDSSGRCQIFQRRFAYGCRVFHALKKVLKDRGLSTAVGDEGGFAPNLEGTEDALNSSLSYQSCRIRTGKDVMIGMDCASSEFYRDGIYDYTKFEGAKGRNVPLTNR